MKLTYETKIRQSYSISWLFLEYFSEILTKIEILSKIWPNRNFSKFSKNLNNFSKILTKMDFFFQNLTKSQFF